MTFYKGPEIPHAGRPLDYPCRDVHGHTWIHDPLTRKSKMIKEPALLGFLNLGYVMGRAPRNPEWNLNNKMSQLKRVTRE